MYLGTDDDGKKGKAAAVSDLEQKPNTGVTWQGRRSKKDREKNGEERLTVFVLGLGEQGARI